MIESGDIDGGSAHTPECEWFKDTEGEICTCGGRPDRLVPEENRKRIDAMTREELCRMWRHAPIGHALLQEHSGTYFARVLQRKGGFSPKISKSIGL